MTALVAFQSGERNVPVGCPVPLRLQACGQPRCILQARPVARYPFAILACPELKVMETLGSRRLTIRRTMLNGRPGGDRR